MYYLYIAAPGDSVRRFSLHAGRQTIGRAPTNDIVLPVPEISRAHAEIEVRDDEVILRDLGSRNGILYQGQRVDEVVLQPGTSIFLGPVHLTLGEALSTGFSCPPTPDRSPASDRSQVAVEVSGSLENSVVATIFPGRDQDGPLRQLCLLCEELVEERGGSQVEERVLRAAMVFSGSHHGAFVELTGRETLLVTTLGEFPQEKLPDEDVLRHAWEGDKVLYVPEGERVLWLVPLRDREARHGLLVLEATATAADLSREQRMALRVLAQVLGLLTGMERLRARVEEERLRLRDERDFLQEVLAPPREPLEIVAEDARMKDLLEHVDRVAASHSAILLRGETGSGKEILARRIHAMSPRREGPFIPVNCGAIPASLIESTLFGIEKGVATGVERQVGVFEMAHGGTLFLDEVGELPLEVQAKFLRVLEEKVVWPVGARAGRPAEPRIVAATHRDLAQMVREGKFREDLYYRLRVVEVQIPPLRERPDDVLPLARHFVRQFARRDRKDIRGITMEAAWALQAYAWPGNVRELRNVIERAVVLCGGELIDREDLPAEIAAAETVERAADDGDLLRGAWRDVRTRLERLYFEELYRQCEGRVTEMARRAGINRRNVYEKLKRHGIGEEA